MHSADPTHQAMLVLSANQPLHQLISSVMVTASLLAWGAFTELVLGPWFKHLLMAL